MDNIVERADVQEVAAVACPEPGGSELLPGGPERFDLKPERVQELLAALPGWGVSQDGRAIETGRRFASVPRARSFVVRSCRLATQQRQPVGIRLSGKEVVVTLPGHPVRGCTGGLTTKVFKLAGLIG